MQPQVGPDACPGRGAARCIASGTRNSLRRACTPIHFSNSPFRSRGAFLRPGFATLASPTRIEGWAERRETFGCVRGTRWACHLASKTRVNALMTRQARRLRGALRPIARQDARERAYDAGRSPLGAPPWRFFTRGRASLTGICAGSDTASSSQPGRSAWRATSRASRGKRLQAAAAGRHASLRIQDRL